MRSGTTKYFILQYFCHNQFGFCFRNWKHQIEKHLIANFTSFHSFINITCIIPLLNLVIFKTILNLQEWDQNLRNCKSLFQQIVIVYKTFTVRIKTKNLLTTTRFCLWSFYKTVTCSKRPRLSGPKSGPLIQVWL